MNTPDSLNSKPKNFLNLIITNWESLDKSQKLVRLGGMGILLSFLAHIPLL